MNTMPEKFHNKTDIAYLAGLFDGEGCVTFKKYPKNYKRKSGKIDRYKTWSIRLEVSMTDKDVIEYIQKVLNVGTVTSRKPHHTSMGIRMQWRWRCTHRQAYKVCSLFYPYSIVKKEKHKSIIDHYEKKVVDINEYKKASNG